MLITFSCTATSDVTMFGDVAINILKIMGYDEKLPNAMSAKDVPQALAKLKAAIEIEKAQQSDEVEPDKDIDQEQDENEETDDVEPAISLKHRSFPLIKLLNAAIRDECPVMWDVG
ncbi:DUF1840 domain-containing protein [Alkalimonas collagenimarina]|uniref:DUF1840 domain-containing protein n=1 Tax=Alkalimonas collagenimarina TaxID=400390 RepID=A0ABT9GWN8_9GAMM|nr:DUF1840 domain-containing protein [Alkalimonas collagenimarina]MDP4535477.1 DUF1840 domain-containing protein [Alkalimonas collagenimarina]